MHFSNIWVFVIFGHSESSTTTLWLRCDVVLIHLCVTSWVPSPHWAEHFERVISQLKMNVKIWIKIQFQKMTIHQRLTWLHIPYYMQYTHRLISSRDNVLAVLVVHRKHEHRPPFGIVRHYKFDCTHSIRSFPIWMSPYVDAVGFVAVSPLSSSSVDYDCTDRNLYVHLIHSMPSYKCNESIYRWYNDLIVIKFQFWDRVLIDVQMWYWHVQVLNLFQYIQM